MDVERGRWQKARKESQVMQYKTFGWAEGARGREHEGGSTREGERETPEAPSSSVATWHPAWLDYGPLLSKLGTIAGLARCIR